MKETTGLSSLNAILNIQYPKHGLQQMKNFYIIVDSMRKLETKNNMWELKEKQKNEHYEE